MANLNKLLGDSIFSRKNKPFKLLLHGPKWLRHPQHRFPNFKKYMFHPLSGQSLAAECQLSFRFCFLSVQIISRVNWGLETPGINSSWLFLGPQKKP